MKVIAIVNGEPNLNSVLTDSPEAVGTAIKTKLNLWLSEWYLNLADGTDWLGSVIGFGTPADLTIQQRILSTPGVKEIVSYSSTNINRKFTVNAEILTAYSLTPLSLVYYKNI